MFVVIVVQALTLRSSGYLRIKMRSNFQYPRKYSKHVSRHQQKLPVRQFAIIYVRMCDRIYQIISKGVVVTQQSSEWKDIL